jgi:F-type H+-transporting ATPase subunit a
MRSIKFLLFFFILFTAAFSTSAEEKKAAEEEKFNLVEFAMHHISDSYFWDFYTKQNKEKARIELPRILWNKNSGSLTMALTTKRALAKGYVEESDYDPEAKEGSLLIPESKIELDKIKAEFESEKDSAAKAALVVRLEEEIHKYKPIDFSITKNVLFILIISCLLLIVFISIAKAYKTKPNTAPKGMQSLFEPIIVFIRDDIVKPNIPHHYNRYLPYLLTVFFFICFLNLSGLIPFTANVTGNITVTASLALLTLLITNFSAKGTYWKHILWYPGIPVFVKPIMLIVELISIFTKPFALTIRLFANMTAGHMVIISFISLIFIFGELGNLPAVGFFTSFFSIIFALFIDCIEIFIALLQAYIFTMLSALFIGQAVEEAH